MKNALILHGTDGNAHTNWFWWLNEELKKSGFNTWVPDLPHAEKPNIQTYNEFLFSRKDWDFNDSILIGHSSGAVAILGLLQDLPADVTVDTCYLVGAFKDDLGWDALKDLFIQPLDFKKIKTKAKRFIFIHSDNDPHCPLDGAKYLKEKVGGTLILQPGQFHFSIGTAGEKYSKFPFLLELIIQGSSK